MKKIYSCMLFVLLAAIGFAAKAAMVQFTLKVDVADRIVAQTMGTSFWVPPTIVPLVDGVNEVNANSEATFNLIASEAVYQIASVIINGVEQVIDTPERFEFYVPSDFGGSVVEVTTKVVDPNGGEDPQDPNDPQDPQVEMCKVSFDFADEAAKAYITGVSIYGDPVADWAEGFEVEKGTPIEMSVNTALKTEVFTINGIEPMVIVGTVNFQVDDNTVIAVKLLEVKEVKVTINVDDASAVEVGYSKTTMNWGFPMTTFVPFALENGANVLSIDPDVTTTLTIRPAGAGFAIKSITVNGAAIEFDGEATVDITDGMAIDITTATAERDAVATVNCDDPTAITLTVGGEIVALTETSQQVPFFSESENTFTVAPANYDVTIYAVTLNGNPVEKSVWSGNYTIYGVQNGDVITVSTTPQEYTLTFDFADEASKAVITKVTKRDGMTEINITDQIDNVISLPQGTYIAVYTNPDMEVEEFTVTGSEVLVYPNEYDFTLAGNTVVTVKAAEKAKTTFTIDVDDAANVSVYYTTVTTNWMGIPQVVNKDLYIVDGSNVFEMADAPETIYVAAKDGYEITGITIDGNEVVVGESTPIQVVDGMVVKITSAAVVNTYSLTFDFADEVSKAFVTKVLVRSAEGEQDITDQIGAPVELPQGVQVLVYTDPDMVLEDFTVNGSVAEVYPNEYVFDLTDNTVVTVKASEKVVTSFTINVDNAANVRVYYNVETVSWTGKPMTVKVDIPLVDGENVISMTDAPEAIRIVPVEGAVIDSITVDGAEAQAFTDIPVVDGMTIVIESSEVPTTGIAAVLCGAKTADVYSVSGVKVLNAADADAINALPAGVYIANGRKFIVR